MTRSVALVTAIALAVMLTPVVASAAAFSISGTVYQPGGTVPAGGIAVRLFKTSSPLVPFATTVTNSDGTYSVTASEGFNYVVEFGFGSGSYIAEFWNDKPSFGSADVIFLTGNRTGIDAVLANACAITGTVRDSGGTGLVGVTVNAYRYRGGTTFDTTLTAWATSGPTGNYSLGGLPAGSYGLQFYSGTYAQHYRSDDPTSGVTARDRATPVTVTSGTLNGIDETMLNYGGAAGRVGSATGPVPNAGVTSYRWEAGAWRPYMTDIVKSDASGDFAVPRLYPGRYRIEFADPTLTYPVQYHLSTLAREMATDVVISTGATTTLNTWLVASDTQAPSSSVSGIPAGWASSITPSITATDGPTGSGVAAIRYRIDGGADTTYTAPFAVTGEGHKTLYYWAVDGFGNLEDPPQTAAMDVDTVAPAAPGAITVAPSGWSSASSFSLTWTNPAQAGSPITGKRYTIDVAPTSPTDGTYVAGSAGSLSIPSPGEGSHTVYVWLVDEAGNADEHNRTTAAIRVDSVAPAAPVLADFYPAPWSNTSDFHLTWMSPDQTGASPIAGKYWRVDTPPTSSTDGTLVAGATPSLTITGLPEGRHPLYVWLVDEAGNADEENRLTEWLCLDMTPPGAPVGLERVGSGPGPVSFTWTNPAWDGLSQVLACYKLDSPPTDPYDGAFVMDAPSSLSGITPPTEGSHTLYVWLVDEVANGGPYASVTFDYRSAPPAPVHRFYNRRTGTHFYTADEAEKADVIARLGWLYTYEGPAYNAYATETAGTIPLFRFYNMRTGTHFYTADADERDRVIANLSAIFAFEGTAYYVMSGPGIATGVVYRFYNGRAGTHFYTADEAEKADVIARLGWLYAFEGPAYFVPR